MPSREPIWLTIAHSPDPDDVFMWWPLGSRAAEPSIDCGAFRFDPIAEDIQVLNERAITRGDLDITAVSIATYPLVARRYRLTDCAGSFGEGYGPKLVVRDASDAPRSHEPASDEHRRAALEWLTRPGRVLAIPGVNTSAFLTLKSMAPRPIAHRVEVFHAIPGTVARAGADAGLLIHDAQLTYASQGLREIGDLGVWWGRETSLPLPLGGNVVRRDLDERYGAGTVEQVTRILRRSIEHALANREESFQKIAPLTIGLDRPTLDRYLEMYVSPLTVEAGPHGERAIERLLRASIETGELPWSVSIDFARGGS